MSDNTIILAGATGHLGSQVAQYLLQKGAPVKALVRKDSTSSLQHLKTTGVELLHVDFDDRQALINACKGGSCVVSALSGLQDVMIKVQTQLLDAAVAAGVPRFIPSDYCIDYRNLPPGSNRNLDLRRQFNQHLDQQPIAATSILNGMFTDLLTGQAPIILKGINRVMYWGNASQALDFTTMDNTAEYTAKAALENATPRYLCVAGQVATIKDVQKIASEVYDHRFKLLRPGGLAAFKGLIKITRFVAPQKDEVFPAWQGMQYMYDMFTGLPKFSSIDNERYPGINWTGIKEVLARAK